MDIIGKRLAGKYEIKSEIGQGGMGVVYEGYDAMLRRRVAVKVLAPGLAGDPAFVKRFEREAAAAAGLHHANIVTIFDVGSERLGRDAKQPMYYIVMQYVDGQSLDSWIATQGRSLSLSETDRIVCQVADALQYAHDQGMIHRDVKPSNVMVGANTHVTLMDFGLVHAADMSQLTQSGKAMGTPSYMAPEQIVGGTIDRRTDVYALGVVIYELLAGETPFVRDTPVATAHAHVYDPPPPLRARRPDLPAPVEAVVLKALAKQPEQRYAETRLLAADLAAATTGQLPIGLFAAKDPTVPMDRPPRPPAYFDDTQAGAALAKPQPFSDETIPPDRPLPELPTPTADPDLTVAASQEAPISAWDSMPVFAPVAQASPASPMMAPAQVSPAPRAPAAEARPEDRYVWIGVGSGVLVALALVAIGLADGSIVIAATGVLIGLAALAVAVVTGRSRALRARPRSGSTSGSYCLRCGHALPYGTATCPSCGYKGGFEEPQ